MGPHADEPSFEVPMESAIQKPSKEQIRDWLTRRQIAPAPLPALDQIRRELNWAVARELPAAVDGSWQ